MNTFEKYVGDRETNADTEEVEADHGSSTAVEKTDGNVVEKTAEDAETVVTTVINFILLAPIGVLAHGSAHP